MCRRRGHRFEIEEQPCENDDSYRCSVRFVRIDSLGRQDGNHVPDYERYGQGYFRYWGSRPGIQANKPPSLCTLGQLCVNADLPVEVNQRALLANLLLRHAWPATACTTIPPHPLRLKVRIFKAGVMETTVQGCCRWNPTVAHLGILRMAHHRLPLRGVGWKRKTSGRSLSHAILHRRARQDWL